MRRLMTVVLVAGMLCAGGASAQQQYPGQGQPMQGPGGGEMQMGMMGQMAMMGRIMPMMDAPDVAAWDGSIYLLSAMSLQKLNADLEPVKTIEFEQMPGMMEGMMGEEGGVMMPGGGVMGGPMRGPGQRGGGMMGRSGMMSGDDTMPMMRMMHGMHRGRMMSNSRVTADARGVYVLRGSTLTAYDHDLNQVRSAEVVAVLEDAAGCPMCKTMMQRMQEGGMMGPGMMGGGMMGPGMMGGPWSAPRERPLEMGRVQLSHRLMPSSGQVIFRVAVLTAAGGLDGSASVSGFVYPKGQPAHGRAVQFTRGPGGHLMGAAQIAAAAVYELALRVKRAGREDAVVYYEVPAGA
ncbi:MAG: hypothetical protein AB7Y46_18370 [Armatimonadota bacterium]